MKRLWAGLWDNDCASQMVEFAVSLPLLIVMVVGIFDFSGAYTLKQKLANAAREGARAAAADPATDLGNGGTPASVSDAFQVVDNYLKAEQINDCGINPGSGSQAALTWTFTATAAPCNITLTINRGYITGVGVTATTPDCSTSPAAAAGTRIVATCVYLSYAYKWHFNSVITVLLPTAGYPGTTPLAVNAVALNEN
jgi:Flp pilus assembly protein TadG